MFRRKWGQQLKIKKAETSWAELGQAQDKLKVIVDVGVEVQVKVGAEFEVSVHLYKPGLMLEFTKLILNPIQI